MKISKSTLSVAASIILGIVLLTIVFSKYPLSEILSSFSNITAEIILAYAVVSLLIMMVLTLRWKVILEAQGYKQVSFRDAFAYRIIDYGVSYVTPSAKLGGEPVRAAMLKRNGIGFKEGLATVVTDKTVELSFTLLAFIFGVTILLLGYAIPAELRILLVLVSGVLLFIIWKFYSKILQGKPVFLSFFRFLRLHKIKWFEKRQAAILNFEKPIISFYNEKRKAFLIAFALSVVAFFLSMAEYALLLRMLNLEASFGVIFMVFSVVGISFMIPVPMALGSLEALQAWLFSLLKLGSVAGIGLAMITRSRDLLWVLIAIILALYHGSLKKVISEAYNAKHYNPLVKMRLFRNGKPIDVGIKLHRNKNEALGNIDAEGFMSLASLKKRFVDFHRAKKAGEQESQKPDHRQIWEKKK